MNVVNADKIKQDFPVLKRLLSGKTIVYMDSACMSLKPMQVISAMVDYYENYPACAGRSMHKLGNEATEHYENARKTVAKFIGAKSEEIIFTKNTTEGINLVAHALSWKKSDVVVTSDREHNSNLIPWQLLREKVGIQHQIVRSRKDETFDIAIFEKTIRKNTKLVSVVHVSNIDGYEMPAKEITKIAHDHDALVLVDGAQSVPHRAVDVHKLGCDFLAFSGHKMLGPSIGVLYAKKDAQDMLEPFMTGGDTVENTTYTDHKFLKPPYMFEAGLQNYAGAIGLAAACKYLEKMGMKNVEKHEQALTEKIREEISSINGIRFVGARGSDIIAFNIENMGFHNVAIMLDEMDNVMIRSGQHCAHSWFNARNIPGCCRASLYVYNSEQDVARFAACLKKVASSFSK